ncbi:unnamed protein product (macronuclear) [Paramecium tetraurelia]|uniref:Uncharacterized protein n=1 Tax=Paramecium tetraurelia TaxID=5888 RepID=A0CVU4_PARTE|nr:uncharacterized protein GSPATT00001113001 [Paramecium tetraurelia]CAK74911.1 unnamed protein product [Paramecium tetraurelia]|eukprot:XP_001442308.1 hypothetical protein (macronuclear) [Paramecium tetraurelia strain d4-2]
MNSFQLRSRLDDLEGQFKQSKIIIKQREQQIQLLKSLLDNQKQHLLKRKGKYQNNKPVSNSNNQENMKISEYQFIIEQLTEEIEKMKRNPQGLGEDLTELLTQITSVFLKKINQLSLLFLIKLHYFKRKQESNNKKRRW